MADWYSDTFRKLHLDWHQPPWIKNPAGALNQKTAREQVRMFKRAGIQAVEFFVYDHHGQAYFPTKIGVRHPLSKVDYPGLMLEALHGNGMKAIGYMNVLTSIHLSEKHPDWFVKRPDGTNPRGAWLTYPHSWLCLGSPYADEYFLPLVEEVLGRYELDGLWLDALSWMVDTLCHCPSCRRRFRKATGESVPKERPADLGASSDSERALWFAWKTYRLGLVTEFHEKVVSLAHRLRPGIVVMDNNAGQANRPLVELKDDKFVRWVPSSELLLDALSCDPVPMGGNHEYLLSLHARHQVTTGKPFDYMNERFHCWGEWQTRSTTDWKLEFATVLANGGRCFFADNPYPDGTLEPRVYQLLKECYGFVEAREPMCQDAEPVFEVGVLAAGPSMAFGLPMLHDSPCVVPEPYPSDRIGGAHLASVELGLQTHVYDEPTLRLNLDKLRCVIVPDQELLDQTTVEALDEFVRKGGRLLVTGGSGRFDEQFNGRSEWPFEEMAGVRFEGEWPAPVNYFRPVRTLVAKGRDLEELPVECWGRAIHYKNNGARELASLSEPLPDVWLDGKRKRENYRHHTVTGACPPSREISGGAIFLHQYGKGKVMTMAMDPFARYPLEGHRLLRGLIDACLETLYPKSTRKLSFRGKPMHIETHLMCQPGRWVLHAVNYFAQKRRGSMVTNDEVPPSQPFTAEIRPPFEVERVTVEPGGRPVKFLSDNGRIRAEVPSFELHAALVFHARKKRVVKGAAKR